MLFYSSNREVLFISVAIKIQKISADNKDAIIFSVNETDYSTKEDRASISLPSGIFKGQGTVINGSVHRASTLRNWVFLC